MAQGGDSQVYCWVDGSSSFFGVVDFISILNSKILLTRLVCNLLLLLLLLRLDKPCLHFLMDLDKRVARSFAARFIEKLKLSWSNLG